ncbi:MAG: dynamin family protein [Pseudomonadota bacterium]
MTAESSETHSAPPQATAATARRGAPAQTGLIRQAYEGLGALADRLRRLEGALVDLEQAGGPATAPTTKKLRRQIRQFQPSVTMIGQVKAGKTTLVNAMAGWPDLLPADINPWTSVVTSLHLEPGLKPGNNKAKFRFFSEEEWDHLLSRGGRVGELASRAGAEQELEKVRAQLQEMREKSRRRLGNKFEMLLGQEHEYGYVDEQLIQRYVCLGDDFGEDTPADQSQGRFADITRSADLLMGQSELPMRMCIRDTPGVNDTFMIREQITVNAIRASKLCVVVLSAHQALSTVDMALIRLISNIRSREVIIFVNRIDELTDPVNEIPEIQASIEATLRAQDGPKDAQIIFGSAFWASHALEGGYESLGQASAEALLAWGQHAIEGGLAALSVEDMVWTLSGMPALCKAISERVIAGEGAEFEANISGAAQNLASALSASHSVAKKRATGGPVTAVAPDKIGAEMTAIAERHVSAVEGKFDELIRSLDDRLENSRRSFLTRATASLIKHLEDYGEHEVWTYDPAGLRVLLRSGYRVFAAKAEKASGAVFQAAADEIKALYMGAFQPGDSEYGLQVPVVPKAPAPVMLGQTIALDIKGNWWSRWWRKRRSYDSFTEEFAGMIGAEIDPMIGSLSCDHAEPYLDQVKSALTEFIERQRASILEVAQQTQSDPNAASEARNEEAEAKGQRLAAAMDALSEFRPENLRSAAE